MRISIYGLGYVGCVSMGCLAELGHEVFGIDENPIKVDLINQGKPTIVEKDIDKLIAKHKETGRIRASMDPCIGVLDTEVSIICVGTPSSEDGSLNLEFMYKCAEQIGEALRTKDRFHTIAIRSTVMPGTNYKVGQIIETVSGKIQNIDFGIVSNPEFLREGSAVKDYFNPPVTVIGSDCKKSINIMQEIYKEIEAEFVVTDIEVAEIIKYVNNSFHALKVTFANEVGNVCKQMNIDSHKVMDVFCKDRQLNISDYYFKPGFAYGGSCLPKDLGAMVALSQSHNLIPHVLSSINPSNEYQKKIAYNLVKSVGEKRIGIIGVSFKQGTDDLRYSAMVDVLNWLLDDGYEVFVYDENVRTSLIIGANKEFIDSQIPHLSEILVASVKEIFQVSDAIVINQKNAEIESLMDSYPEKIIIDFIRAVDQKSHGRYLGLCW